MFLTNSRKIRFPRFLTTALPNRRPTTIPIRVFPSEDMHETRLKNLVAMRLPSRLTRLKSSDFFRKSGGEGRGTSLIGY